MEQSDPASFLRLDVGNQAGLTHLHPRQVTLDRGMSHGAAEWVRAPCRGELRSARRVFAARLRRSSALVHLRLSASDGPGDRSSPANLNVAPERKSSCTGCCSQQQSPKKTAEQAKPDANATSEQGIRCSSVRRPHGWAAGRARKLREKERSRADGSLCPNPSGVSLSAGVFLR